MMMLEEGLRPQLIISFMVMYVMIRPCKIGAWVFNI